MIKCNSVEKLNYYLNHSEIYPNITKDGDPEHLDASELLSKSDTYFFRFDGGGLLFYSIGDNVYEGDVYFLPRKRGLKAKTAAKQSLDYMFNVVKVDKIIARVPFSNKSSRVFTTGLGFKRAGKDGQWIKEGVACDIIKYEMRKEWAE